MDVLTTVETVVTIIGTIGVLVIGTIGLSTWRWQLKGTAEYDVAKRAVLLTRLVCDALQAVRDPMLYLRKDKDSLEEEQRIYSERLAKLHQRWAELRPLALETGVIWGEEAEKRFDPIRDLIGTLQTEVWTHFWLKGAYAAPGTTVDNNPERVAANRRIVYRVSEDDEFSKRVKAAILNVETFFGKHIRG